jgi:hypothetical protein
MNRNFPFSGLLLSVVLFLVGCSDSRKAEVEAAKDAAVKARAEAEIAKINADRARSETEAAKANLDKARLETEKLRLESANVKIAPAEPAEKDLKQLQGVWYLVAGEYSGRKETWKGQSVPVKMLIEGKRFTFALGTKVMEGTFELECAALPDLEIHERRSEGQRDTATL